MKYALPSPRDKFTGVLAGYSFVNGICEVSQPSVILEKYYLAYEFKEFVTTVTPEEVFEPEEEIKEVKKRGRPPLTKG